MKQAGFTMIEILVVVTVVIILSGAGLATFLNFQQRRQVQDDASSLADRLRTIQIKAVATEVPVGCTSVKNYTTTLVGANLTVAATCLVPDGVSIALPTLTLALANSSFGNGPLTVIFDSRSVTAGPTTVDICGNNILYRVTISESANVSRPVFIEGGC